MQINRRLNQGLRTLFTAAMFGGLILSRMASADNGTITTPAPGPPISPNDPGLGVHDWRPDLLIDTVWVSSTNGQPDPRKLAVWIRNTGLSDAPACKLKILRYYEEVHGYLPVGTAQVPAVNAGGSCMVHLFSNTDTTASGAKFRIRVDADYQIDEKSEANNTWHIDNQLY
jgi:hypothetical protein